MDKVVITPSKLSGRVYTPPSKSLSHRYILCASMAKGVSVIDNIILSKDIQVTIEAVKTLGASVKVEKSSLERDIYKLTIDGTNTFSGSPDVTIDCNESGSTLRFLIPISLINKRRARFTGIPYLATRPLDPFFPIFEQDGVEYKNTTGGNLDFLVNGCLKGGKYSIAGNVSSQFITGLLYSLPLMECDSQIVITDGLQSKGYIDLTLQALKMFGIDIVNNNYESFIIKGNQKYSTCSCNVEGDFSQGAFFLCAGALGNNISVDYLNADSLQGDKKIIECLEKLGCKIVQHGEALKVIEADLVGAVIDGSEFPDIIPILSVVCALAKGTSRLTNIGRLRIKECDRLNVMAKLLSQLGVKVEELEDELIIHGTDKFTGGELSSYNDHRIAMSMAIASTRGTQPFIIDEPNCVQKSYPHFWEDMKMLGADINE